MALVLIIIRVAFRTAFASTGIIFEIPLWTLVALAIIVKRVVSRAALTGSLIICATLLAFPALPVEIIGITVLTTLPGACVILGIPLWTLVTFTIIIKRVISRAARAGSCIVHTALLALPAFPVEIIRVAWRTAVACTCSVLVIPLRARVAQAIIIERVTIQAALASAGIKFVIPLWALVALAIIVERVTIRAAVAATWCVDMITRWARRPAYIITTGSTAGWTTPASPLRAGFTVRKHDAMSRPHGRNVIKVRRYRKNR
jgi:hypothetical protein